MNCDLCGYDLTDKVVGFKVEVPPCETEHVLTEFSRLEFNMCLLCFLKKLGFTESCH